MEAFIAIDGEAVEYLLHVPKGDMTSLHRMMADDHLMAQSSDAARWLVNWGMCMHLE